MATQLAWHNLVHNKIKTGIAVAGVVFAIVLMFMQLGFLEAVKVSATLIYDQLDFDICLRSRDYLNLGDPRWISRQQLRRATTLAEVEQAVPLTVATCGWRNPRNGRRMAIICLGAPSAAPLFLNNDIQQSVDQLLRRRDTLLIDTATRREYGPANGRQFGPADDGTRAEINNTALTIAGHYTCGTGLSCGGAAILNEATLQRLLPGISSDQISLGLVRVKDGADPYAVAAELRQLVGQDLDVLTRDEVLAEEIRYWVYDTNYGLIFQLGVVVSLIVGTAIVYQVLASDVARLLPEYATLKAMGYSNGYLAGVILQQALALALLGFIGGTILALLLYELTTRGAGIPVQMTRNNLLLVLGLSIVMCTCSGLAALRKAFRADPADLF